MTTEEILARIEQLAEEMRFREDRLRENARATVTRADEVHENRMSILLEIDSIQRAIKLNSEPED